MSVTLRDCLKLPSLSLGRVIAGHGGLDNIVATVSVMEFDDEEEEDFVTPNELLISALYCVKDDVQAQCRMLRQCKNNGDVGLVLFYADMILGSVDERLGPIVILSAVQWNVWHRRWKRRGLLPCSFGMPATTREPAFSSATRSTTLSPIPFGRRPTAEIWNWQETTLLLFWKKCRRIRPENRRMRLSFFERGLQKKGAGNWCCAPFLTTIF